MKVVWQLWGSPQRDLWMGHPMNETPAPKEKFLERYPTEQDDLVELVVDSLIHCHLCHFHVCVYGEVGYLMISDLKSKAEARFGGFLMSCL